MTSKSNFLLIVLALSILSLPLVTEAQFKPLVGIPGVAPNSTATFGDYMNALYALAISLAGLLAVVKIVIAGAKYMLSDVVTSKEDAKKDIKGALFGLLIVMAAALILTVINPNLLKNNIILQEVSSTGGVKTPVPKSQSTFQAGTLPLELGQCQSKGSQYVLKKIGNTTECCIPGGAGTDACSDNSGSVTVTNPTGVSVEIDTDKVYATGELPQFFRELKTAYPATTRTSEIQRVVGNTVPLSGTDLQAKIDQLDQECVSKSGDPFTIQRDRIGGGINYDHLCVR